MDYISSSTLMQAPQSKDEAYNLVYQRVKTGWHYLSYVPTLKDYYSLLGSCIEYFKEKEEFEKCKVLTKARKNSLKEIPSSVNEALKFMIDSLKDTTAPIEVILSLETKQLVDFSIPTVGKTLKDQWLLDEDVSPLRQHLIQRGENPEGDNLLRGVLTKYYESLKAKIEYERENK